MTNWPNIQEYRNFEAKFINDPTNYLSINSAAESDSILKNDCEIKNSLDDFFSNQQYHNFEAKIVRCVIKKDFEESFKKLDRGDGVGINHEASQAKPQEANQLLVDQIRLKNHLKWKRQKDEEYLQKKEAERIAQQKKKEEEFRLEIMKKKKEKEREEKLREWQEQKSREKEEKKKEKIMMKVLEEKLKVTPTPVDKEKLIGEWVKLKDKQKQMEAEKKAELQKKEEESRELRQNLAKLSYKKWKESIKGRMMTLPKNGYQIFGPKPTPVVKEDWNHDFTSSSPRNQSIIIRQSKSNMSTSLSFRPSLKEFGDLSKNVFYLEDLKTRSPSFYHLRTAKSGLNLVGNCDVTYSSRLKLPLKELQQGTIDSQKNARKSLKKNLSEKEDFISEYLSKISNKKFFSKLNEKDKHSYLNQRSPNFLSFLSMEGDQNQFMLPPQSKKLPNLIQDFPDHQVLPNKKKLDLYINTGSDNTEVFPTVARERKQLSVVKKVSDVKLQKGEKKDIKDKKISKDAFEIRSKENFRSRTVAIRSTSLQKEAKHTNVNVNSKITVETTKSKVCQKSRSCEKPAKKFTKNPAKVKCSSSSRSLAKMKGKAHDGCDKFGATSAACCIQKMKIKKQLKSKRPVPSAEKSEKKRADSRKKAKKNGLSKSFSFSDSPYFSKNFSKGFDKVKGRRKTAKDEETKSDGAEHSRKLSATKI